MRLYQIELYKLCHKKIVPPGILCLFAAISLLFILQVKDERSTVNGAVCHGYAAIKADQEITRRFRGPLTDEKLREITDQYGFPQNVEKYYGLTDANFLNQFVMQYASDGYIHGWDDYKLATQTVPLADTQLGQAGAAIGKDILLEYFGGWEQFAEGYMLNMILVSILILCTVSTTYATEEQSHIKALLFTTTKGPTANNLSKIAASFTLSVGLWLFATVFHFLLYGVTYGLSGLNCMTGLVDGGSISAYWMLTTIPFRLYLLYMFCLSLLGILELCAVTLAVSARCHTAFHAVCTAAACWTIPLFLFFILRNIYQILAHSTLPYSMLLALSVILFVFQCLIYSAPFYLINQDILWELSVMDNHNEFLPFAVAAGLACAGCILCILYAYRRYQKQ